MASAQVNCFMAVVKYQSFSKAAEHLYVSQSAVSKNISQLEKSVGYILIDRTNGAVRPTQVGRLFYDHYVEAEEKYKQLLENVKLLTSSQADDIRIGCLDGWDLSQFYPQIRNVFREKYPAVNISLEGYDHIHILEALNENKIDVAVTLAITLPRQGRFVSRTIATAPAIMMFSSSHPLAENENIRLQDFKDEPFYVISPAGDSQNPMEQLTLLLCRAAGFEPRLEYAPNSATILMRLQSGSGVQITCDWTTAGHFSIYKTVPLEHKLNICAAWIDDGNNSSKHTFVNELLRLDLKE